MALGGYCYLLLLLLGSSCAVTYAQCEDETDCSSRCNPGIKSAILSERMSVRFYCPFLHTERWRRQLCVFYSRLQDWRSTAVECGLHVPDFGNFLRENLNLPSPFTSITSSISLQPSSPGLYLPFCFPPPPPPSLGSYPALHHTVE